MMDKKELKTLIRKLRNEQDTLWKKYNNHNIFLEISLKATTGEIMEVNPYSFDLRNGKYFGRDLLDGEFKHVCFFKGVE